MQPPLNLLTSRRLQTFVNPQFVFKKNQRLLKTISQRVKVKVNVKVKVKVKVKVNVKVNVKVKVKSLPPLNESQPPHNFTK